MVFHVLSIPTHPTRKEITLCAFTQKVYKFCKVMTGKGHTVFHYGHPDSRVPCTEHFNVVSRATYDKVYKKQQWQNFHPQSIRNEVHKEFNKNAAALIKKNKQEEQDFVLAFWGIGHRECCEQLKGFCVVFLSPKFETIF